MKSAEVIAALRKRHGCDAGSAQWVCIEEAFSGFTTAGGGIDLLAIGAWQTAKIAGCPGAGRLHYGEPWGVEDAAKDARYPIVAYEVKVTRADYRREVNGYKPGPNAKSWKTRPVHPWPAKAHWALASSHFYMFATPKGLLKPAEIARRERPEDGTVSAREGNLWLPPEAGLVEVDGRGCHVVVAAPRRPAPPPWERGQVAELVRHAVSPNKLRTALADAAHWEARYRETVAALRELEDERYGR